MRAPSIRTPVVSLRGENRGRCITQVEGRDSGARSLDTIRGLTPPARLALSAIVVACLFALLPAIVYARAGGGESFGGGSNGGGSGGGDIPVELIWLLIRLIIYYPHIGLPTLIIIGVIAYFAFNAGRSGYVTRTIRRAGPVQVQREIDQALAELRSRDPQFDLSQFIARGSRAFVKIQQAWSDQNLAPVRAFISDGVLERFSLQLEMQQALGFRNKIENVTIHEARLAAVSSDIHFDAVHVSFRASADDYREDLETGRRRSESSLAGEFVEYWSFQRRRGVVSRAEAGSLEDRCPSCGAPLDIVDRAVCGSCGSVVNSGEYDWVLTEISQEGEWIAPDLERLVPGLDRLRAQDPQFCTQHVEDRVSVMFWRLRAAEFFAEPARARPVITDRMANALSKDRDPPETRKFWQDPAVGKVELLDADLAPEGDNDRLRVLVRWSGVHCAGDPRGKHQVVGPKRIYSHVFVLLRKSGVQSTAAAVFSSSACANCGAPVGVSEQANCPYCGAVLNDGRYDWVLDEIEPFTPELAFREPAPGASSGKGRPEPKVDPELSLAILARIMTTDGELAPRELQALGQVAGRRGLSEAQVQAVIETSQNESVSLPVPRDPRQAARFLRQMVSAGLVDGKITTSERTLLTDYAGRMNLSAADVDLEIARQRGALFREGKATLRAARKGAS